METRREEKKEAPYLRDGPSVSSPEFIKEYYRKQIETFQTDKEQEQ
jgi:hypothetical protein